MFENKGIKIVSAISLGIVFVLVAVFGFFCHTQQKELLTRQITVNSVGNLTYFENYENFMKQFTNYENVVEDNNLSFSGLMSLNPTNYGIDYLSSSTEVIAKYFTTYNIEDNTFEVVTFNYIDDVLISQVSEIGIPVYDEKTDDVLLRLGSGAEVSVKEALGCGKEDCFVIAVLTGTLVAALLFTAVVAPVIIDPSFYQPVADSVGSVFGRIGDFFDRLFTKSTTKVKTVDKYLTLSSADEKKAKEPPRDIKIYQIAYCTNNSQLRASKVKLKWLEALAVLNVFKPLNKMLQNSPNLLSEIGKIDINTLDPQVKVDVNAIPKSASIGIYTQHRIDAAKLANAVEATTYRGSDVNSGKLLIETHNTNVGSGYYYHFHDSAHQIHIWYGNPI